MTKRCPTCGYRVRGKNHNKGTHHNGPSRKSKRTA